MRSKYAYWLTHRRKVPLPQKHLHHYAHEQRKPTLEAEPLETHSVGEDFDVLLGFEICNICKDALLTRFSNRRDLINL